MSLQGSLFEEDVEYDVTLFLKDNKKKRVLVFPPVNSYQRYLIHQLVQDRFADFLHTFSIGQGLERRTVVCYKTDIIREPGSNGGEQKESPLKTSSCGMGFIERRQSPSKSPERIRLQQQQQPQQRHADPRIVSNSKSIAPAVEIYVPPPARRARNNELRSQHRETSSIHVKAEDSNSSSNDNDLTVLPSTSSSSSSSSFSNVRNSRQRRPDRAVYVPRHRRSGTELEVNNSTRSSHEDNVISQDYVRPTTTTAATAVVASNNAISEEQDISSSSSSSSSSSLSLSSSSSSKLNKESECLISSNINKPNNSNSNRDHSPVISLKSSSVKIENTEEQVKQVKLDEQRSTVSKITDDYYHHHHHHRLTHEEEEEEELESVKGERFQSDGFSSVQETTLIEETCTVEQQVAEVLLENKSEDLSKAESIETDSVNNVAGDVTVVERIVEEPVVVVNPDSLNDKPNMSSEKKDDESKEIVTTNRRNADVKKNNDSNNAIRRNMVPSDVLIISDVITNNKEPIKKAKEVTPVVVSVVSPPEKKAKKIERPKSKPAPPPSPPIKISRDECDWDSLFDDNGDCLDPSLIEELTSAVGEVMIEQPKNDYKVYTNKQVEVSSDEFAHVVEIYNFPSDFKTSDLAAVFSPFKTGGFELKWVDDTHCLGVFSSPLIAAEVLASEHPFVKTRPLSEATALSKTKARRSAEFLQPYRSRPETCAALARRLVTGALGVKLATARQEREHEKNVLREAKEKRRLANKQREDAWEGIIPQK